MRISANIESAMHVAELINFYIPFETYRIDKGFLVIDQSANCYTVEVICGDKQGEIVINNDNDKTNKAIRAKLDTSGKVGEGKKFTFPLSDNDDRVVVETCFKAIRFLSSRETR